MIALDSNIFTKNYCYCYLVICYLFIYFSVDPEVYVPREDDTRYNEVDFDSEDTKYNKGQAHHMFSRILNLQFFFTKFSLFCFPASLVFLQGRSYLLRSKILLIRDMVVDLGIHS